MKGKLILGLFDGLFDKDKSKPDANTIQIQVGFDSLDSKYYIKLIDHDRKTTVGIKLNAVEMRKIAEQILRNIQFYSEMN